MVKETFYPLEDIEIFVLFGNIFWMLIVKIFCEKIKEKFRYILIKLYDIEEILKY